MKSPKRIIAFLMVTLFFTSVLPNLINIEYNDTASAEVVCCNSSEFDFMFAGSGTSATMSPFDSILGDEQRKEVSSSVAEESEIMSWSTSLNFGGTYPQADWKFSIPYSVNNAAGIQLNASVELVIGDSTFIEFTQSPQLYLPEGEGNIEINIPVTQGSISSNDQITVRFSVQSLVFVVPGNEASTEFIWGTSDHRGHISANLQILSIDMLDPIIEGRNVHFPVVLISGFGLQLQSESQFTFQAGGVEITNIPVVEQNGQDIKLTWTWNANSELSDGDYVGNISILLQNGGVPIQAQKSFPIKFTEGDDTGITFYPSTEPVRYGDNALNTKIDVEVDSDEIKRTITLELSSKVSFWLRWGIDNMGNNELNSSSWLRELNPGPNEYYKNKKVDSNEVQSFVEQLKSDDLTTFLHYGLGLEPNRLLGKERSSFERIDIDLELGDDDTVSNTPVKLLITTLETGTMGGTHTLVESFIRPQVDLSKVIWKTAQIEIKLTTSMISGLSSITEEGIDTTHTRLIFQESLSANIDFNDEDIFRISFVQSNSPIESPLIIFIICAFILICSLVLSSILVKSKNKIPLIIEVVVCGLIEFVVYFLAMPFIFVLGIAVFSGIIWVITALLLPRRFEEEEENEINNLPRSRRRKTENIGSNNSSKSRGKRRGLGGKQRDIPTVACPKCNTKNPVSSDERPLKLPCGGCGTVLKIVD